MKFIIGASLLASLASAASVDLAKRDSPLDLTLELVGNTGVRASVTNSGSEPLRVLKTGSILDDVAVEKTEIFSGSEKVEFDGVRVWLDVAALTEENFQTIAAGETVVVEFDVAANHDLSAGGEFDISSAGALSYAEADSLTLSGAAGFRSNVVTATVDGEAAAKVRRDFHDNIARRAVVQSDCTGTRRTQVTTALTNCAALARAASSAATSGGARMTEFFKSDTAATRSTVAGVFNRIATECGSSTSGVSRQFCTDQLGACSGGTVAYTVPSQSYMVNCPTWFNSYAATSSACRGNSQSSITLHEATHLSQIRGTSDYSCYGYTCLRSLTAAQNINHADTYHLFAQAVRAGC